MSEVVQYEELGRGLFAVICRLLFSSGWLRCRAALPCRDEASGKPRAMINRWSRG